MVGIELGEILVLGEVNVFDARVADVENHEVGILRHVKFFHRRGVDGDFLEIGASRWVKSLQTAIAHGIEGAEFGIVREIEGLVQVVHLCHFKNEKVGLVGSDDEWFFVEGVVVQIERIEFGVLSQVEFRDFVVRKAENGEVRQL